MKQLLEYETPETDACYARAGMMGDAQINELDTTCQSLEQRLAACRDALTRIEQNQFRAVSLGININNMMICAHEALTLTAPK